MLEDRSGSSVRARIAGMFPLMICLVSFPLTSRAVTRDSTTVVIYHGAPRVTRLTGLIADGTPHVLAGTNTTIRSTKGARIVLRIQNANPVLYTYALNTAVDTTKVHLPDLTNLLKGIATDRGTPHAGIERQ